MSASPDKATREALRELLADDHDHMVATGESLAWLIEQSVRWPTRIHPERTTNDRFLRFSMAATQLALLDRLDAMEAALRAMRAAIANTTLPDGHPLWTAIAQADAILNQEQEA